MNNLEYSNKLASYLPLKTVTATVSVQFSQCYSVNILTGTVSVSGKRPGAKLAGWRRKTEERAITLYRFGLLKNWSCFFSVYDSFDK